jgi:hypothetical protein
VATRGKRTTVPNPPSFGCLEPIHATGFQESAIAGATVSQTTPLIGSTWRATSAAKMPIHAPSGPPPLCADCGPSTPIYC